MAKSMPRIVVGVGTTIVAAILFPPGVALFVAGVGFGAVGREFVLARQALKAMPALLDVIDWDKLDAHLGEPGPADDRRSPTRLD